MSMETIDKLYLELSQVSRAKTAKECWLEGGIDAWRNAVIALADVTDGRERTMESWLLLAVEKIRSSRDAEWQQQVAIGTGFKVKEARIDGYNHAAAMIGGVIAGARLDEERKVNAEWCGALAAAGLTVTSVRDVRWAVNAARHPVQQQRLDAATEHAAEQARKRERASILAKAEESLAYHEKHNEAQAVKAMSFIVEAIRSGLDKRWPARVPGDKQPFDTLYVARNPAGECYADPDEWAVLAPANPVSAEELRQRAAKMWGIAPDDVTTETFHRGQT